MGDIFTDSSKQIACWCQTHNDGFHDDFYCTRQSPAMSYQTLWEEKARLHKVLNTLQKVAHSLCSTCNGKRRYYPHCYKCDDSGWDHDDCPDEEPCTNKIHDIITQVTQV